ncbi:little elongation complex subunit 1 isoform X1 [Arapaima gigas]
MQTRSQRKEIHNHSKTTGVASDATAGACQNCTVLQESINEYVAALLSLKQKIINTDHLLTEYQEKCDDILFHVIQTSKLHQQLAELLEKMEALEKRNKEYESMWLELEEKRSTLKKYEEAATVMDCLKEENSKTKALFLIVYVISFFICKETTQMQRKESGQLRSEKEALEKELENTKNFLKMYQQAECEVERLKEEKTKILAQKKNLENQFELLKDSSHILEIKQLKLDKEALERKLNKMQVWICKMGESNASTQINTPKEPKIDKAKVRLLLEELWKCVEPQTTNKPHFSDNTGQIDLGFFLVPNNPFKQKNLQAPSNRTSSATLHCESPKTPRTSWDGPQPIETAVTPKIAEACNRGLRKRKRSRNSDEHLNNSPVTKDVELNTHQKQDTCSVEPISSDNHELWDTTGPSKEEIFDLLKPLPPLLSPLSFFSPLTKEAVFGVISDSSDEDEAKEECASGKELVVSLKMPNGEPDVSHQEMLSTKPETTYLALFNGQPIQQTVDVVAESEQTSVGNPPPVSQCTSVELCVRNNVPVLEKLKDDSFKSTPASLASSSSETVMDISIGSYSTAVKEPLSCGMELDQPVCIETINLKMSPQNREYMEKTPEKGSKKDAEDTPFEDALDIVPNGHNHIQNPSANVANLDHHPALLPEGMLYENGNKSVVCKDVEMKLQASVDMSNLTMSSLSDDFVQSESNETEGIKHSNLSDFIKENSTGALNSHSKKDVKGTGLNGCEILGSDHEISKAGCVNDLQLNSSVQNSKENNMLSNMAQCSEDEVDEVKEKVSIDKADDDLALNVQPQIIEPHNSDLNNAVTIHDKLDMSENYIHGNVATEESNEQQAVEAEVSRQMLQTVGNEIEGVQCFNGLKALTAVDDVTEVKSSSEHLAAHKESSDEQESFELHRKVRRSCQRASNQTSTKDIDVLNTLQDPAQKSLPQDNQNLASLHSLNENCDNSPSGEQTQATHSVQLSPNSQLSENVEEEKVLTDSEKITIQESKTDLLSCGNLSYCSELSSEELLLDHKEIPEEKNIAGSSCPTSPDSECFLLPVSIITLSADNKTDQSQSDDEVSSDNCSNVNNQVVNENGILLSGDSVLVDHCREDSCQSTNDVTERHEVSPGDEKFSPITSLSDISPSAKSPGAIKRVRSEMGPPLPPLLLPLNVTPKKPQSFGTPSVKVPSKLSFISPLNEVPSGQKEKSPLTDRSDRKFLSLSPSESKCDRIISSPLQFCSATPKHAVPVPGRFPTSALGTSSNGTQENSVKILDTMYPELSARARTLNILRGNVNLSRSTGENPLMATAPVSQISGFKSINLSSTAFTKTGKSSESENGSVKDSVENEKTQEIVSAATAQEVTRKTGANVHLPTSAKRLRLDDCLPVSTSAGLHFKPHLALAETGPTQPQVSKDSLRTPNNQSGTKQPVDDMATKQSEIISRALTKILSSCFDLLPVIKSHVSIGRISKLPVLRDEEKEVIAEFCMEKKALVDDFLSAVSMKLKTEKNSLSGEQLQALCRVYTGLCRQRGDWERPHLLAYCILKEDFPDSAKLILFVVTTWYNIFMQRGVVCNAMHAVIRQKAHGEVLKYLTAYLDWETNCPCEIQEMITKVLFALQMGTNMKFQHHERYGDDLNPSAWEYIFAIDLLCTEKRWAWTYDNVICKELWPLMNKWVTQRNQHGAVHDVIVATVLRLIGRLGQLGLKEKSAASVKNVAKVINVFGKQGKAEGVPWSVQLAAVYTIYDLSPSDPKDALEALAAWRGETAQPVPPAVTSCITQIGSVCRQVKM